MTKYAGEKITKRREARRAGKRRRGEEIRREKERCIEARVGEKTKWRKR